MRLPELDQLARSKIWWTELIAWAGRARESDKRMLHQMADIMLMDKAVHVQEGATNAGSNRRDNIAGRAWARCLVGGGGPRQNEKKRRGWRKEKKKGGRVQESNLGLYHQVEFYH